jgi:D-alanyl-D-alanine carboxypeptidase
LAIGVLLIVLSAFCCRPAGVATADDSGDPLSARLQQIADDYVAQHAAAEHLTGVELQVSFGPEGSPAIVASAGTDGRPRDPQPMHESTLFQTASNTKSFTAALILQLEAQGKLRLDQMLGDWLPQYPAWRQVTIRSLLNMTSGIPEYFETVEIGQKVASDIHRQFSPEELIAAVDPNQGRTIPPTTGYAYSNTNYLLAGLIIEKASGLPYAEALRAMILRPLHLRDTYYTYGPYPYYVLDRMASGFFADPDCLLYQPQPCTESVLAPLLGRDMRTQNLSYTGPAGGMVSSLGDLARWYRALFGGRVLPPQQWAEMTSVVSLKTGRPIPDTTADDPGGFGLGIARIYSADQGGHYWFYLGETLGYRTLIAYWPQYELVITAEANSNPAADADPAGAPGFVPTILSSVFAALKDTGTLAAKQ